jgi:hypothetical protein
MAYMLIYQEALSNMAVKDLVDLIADPDYINLTLMWLVCSLFFSFFVSKKKLLSQWIQDAKSATAD